MPYTFPVTALMLVILAGLFACGWCWIIAGLRAGVTYGWITGGAADAVAIALRPLGIPPRLPLAEWSPRRPVPWAAFDFGAMFSLWIISQIAMPSILRQSGWLPARISLESLTLDQRQALIVGNSISTAAVLALCLPLIALRTGARPRDFGWSPRELLRDVRLGLIGLVMLAPPVYVLQAVLVKIWQPSSHPLIELFKGSPDLGFYLMLFVAAAVVAPLFEELLFRVILQGFLERAFTHRGHVVELLFDRPRPIPLAVAVEVVPEPEPVLVIPAAFDRPATEKLNPYVSPQEVVEPEIVPVASADEQPELRGVAAWASIAISAIIFALLHFANGPDWVPLTFLAAGMGYLYQRTHRLVPSLVVHAGLNALSMWMLWVHVFEGIGP